MRSRLRAPFPWYGGKSRVADLVWRAFGDVPNLVEPFCGSLAVLLGRPTNHNAKVETANDKDGFICNVWRAIKADPDAVARYVDWPVNEADLHARHQWLVDRAPSLLEQLLADPDYFDAKVAGWWMWGLCTWIGNGWCHRDERAQVARRRPHLTNPSGYGINNPEAVARYLPRIGVPGNGVHAPTIAQGKKPLTHLNKGVNRDGISDVPALFAALSARLRRVRICCGEWYRVLGRSTLGIDTRHGMTPCGVLLDPPYAHGAGRDKLLYRHDDGDVSAVVRAWAVEHGDNPSLRIALCGWEGEHEMPSSWRKVAWTSGGSSPNRVRERVWFSPHCLEVDAQRDLLTNIEPEGKS